MHDLRQQHAAARERLAELETTITYKEAEAAAAKDKCVSWGFAYM